MWKRLDRRGAEFLLVEQLVLGLEDMQQMEAAEAAEAEAKDPSTRAAQARRRRTNRGSLPATPPRFDHEIVPESLARARCTALARYLVSAFSESVSR